MGEIRIRIWTWIGALFFALGIFSCLYIVYDLRFPNHFVGDMYGIELMFRSILLLAAAGPIILGTLLMLMGWRNKSARLNIAGTVAIIASSLAMIYMAVDVALSRHQDEIRKGYPEKSVKELLAIAREQQDQHALDVLVARADPAAVPGLALILLDRSQRKNLRYVSAQALARIGGTEARTALEKARDSDDDAHFKGYLEGMIQETKSRP